MRPWREPGKTRIIAILVGAFLIIGGAYAILFLLPYGKVTYSTEPAVASIAEVTPVKELVAHIETPDQVKAVYLTSWAAGNDKFRTHLYDLVDNTEINSVVIDVKDYTGRISFPVSDPELAKYGASENRIPDIKEFIASLHERGVYVIARISSFQDSYLIDIHPEWAVKDKAGSIWKDYKGVKWLDPGAKPVWDYLVDIGNESYSVGFDELNFDYIRYPSDGNMLDISYSWSDDRSRQEVMKAFFMHLRESFASTSIPISIDLFGLTTSADGDLGIGQSLKDAIQYFDYVSPMVYPSHFANGFIGLAKPAKFPYEVVKYSMDQGSMRALAASSSPLKIRPWLQHFDLGAVYTPAMIRAQIQATYDSGLDSWMLWNAASVYNKEALLPKGATTTSAESAGL